MQDYDVQSIHKYLYDLYLHRIFPNGDYLFV